MLISICRVLSFVSAILLVACLVCTVTLGLMDMFTSALVFGGLSICWLILTVCFARVYGVNS